MGKGVYKSRGIYRAVGFPSGKALADLRNKFVMGFLVSSSIVGIFIGASGAHAATPTGPDQFGTPSLLSQGIFSFQEDQIISTAPQVIDVNGDGKQDVVTLDTNANNSKNSIVVRLGNGDGTFSATKTTLVPDGRQLKVVDVNGDGVKDAIDIRFKGNPTNANLGTFEVRFGNGDGTFASTPEQSIVAPGEVTDNYIADFNGDGYIDVIASYPNALGTNSGTNPVVIVYLNDGSGHFTASPEIPLSTTHSATVVGVADFTGDGSSDLLVGNSSNSGEIWAGDGSGSFTKLAGQGIVGIAGPAYHLWSKATIADFTGDGKPDIATQEKGTNTGADSTALRVYPNLGAGAFGAPISSPRISNPWGLAPTDVDGDGYIDLLGWDTAGVAVYVGNGSGNFKGVQFLTVPAVYEVASGDVNTDGNPDLVFGAAGYPPFPQRPSIALNINPPVDSTPPVLGIPAWSANPKPVTASSTLTIPVNDNLSGAANGEYYLDTDPGPGNATAMTLSNGNLSATFGTSLATGIYDVGIRAKDAAGNWSSVTKAMLVVYDPAGAGMAGKNKKDLVPALSNGDKLPGLISGTQTDAADYGLTVDFKNGVLDPKSDFLFNYSTGTNCGKPAADNCHSFNVAATSFDWLVIDQANDSRGRFQGVATVTVDGVTTTNTFTVEGIDGDRVSATTDDKLVLKVYASGADPSIAVPQYQASGSVNRGNAVKIQ